jgi:hypothetical protein
MVVFLRLRGPATPAPRTTRINRTDRCLRRAHSHVFLPPFNFLSRRLSLPIFAIGTTKFGLETIGPVSRDKLNGLIATSTMDQ